MYTLAFASQAPANEVARWDFAVYLNDKRVGSHVFEIVEVGGVRQVLSEANFKYRILFIPAYRYEHRNAERWSDNCLIEFDARTNANGERFEVSGEKTNAGFRVEKKGNLVDLPSCVMTFAYWNPEFLDQSRLLNPQTGEYIDVIIENVGDELVQVQGRSVVATRFKLTANDVDLNLWYSPDREWLALESVAKGGHIIRYELS
jgi:hypothetical protein